MHTISAVNILLKFVFILPRAIRYLNLADIGKKFHHKRLYTKKLICKQKNRLSRFVVKNYENEP